MNHHYITHGTCSKSIDISIENGVITDCKIENGCRGNTLGLSRMVIGRKAEDVMNILRGIQCRNGTSCPDQLSYAIEACLKSTEKEGAFHVSESK